MDQKPWEVCSDLQEDRLKFVADIIRHVRRESAALYNPEDGDGPWSLGCRNYERLINIIERESHGKSWLSVKRKNNLGFWAFIGPVPIKFCKTDLMNASAEALKINSDDPVYQPQNVFEFDESTWHWRFIIETDEFGEALRIRIGQFTADGNVKNLHEIPMDDSAWGIIPTSKTLAEPVEIEKPKVSLKRVAKIINDEK